MQLMQTKSRQGGFTLIELMIVVAIVAILAAIALPMYQKQIMKSRRASAKTALLDISSREEKYYASNNTYTLLLTNLGYSSNTLSVPSASQNYYSVTIAATNPAGTATSASSYTATAVPNSPQNNDSCKNFTLTDLGVQGVSGVPSDSSPCW